MTRKQDTEMATEERAGENLGGRIILTEPSSMARWCDLANSGQGVQGSDDNGLRGCLQPVRSSLLRGSLWAMWVKPDPLQAGERLESICLDSRTGSNVLFEEGVHPNAFEVRNYRHPKTSGHFSLLLPCDHDKAGLPFFS